MIDIEIDTHTHYNSLVLKDLKKEILLNSLHFKKIINVGLNYETSKEVIEISKVEDKFYAAIGIHPLYEGDVDDLYNLYDSNNKIIAIGETGLDYKGDIKKQRENFIKSILLANHLRLPLIIHANNTNKEVLEILRLYKPLYGFVFHCFQPNIEVLDEIMYMNGYISVNSPILRPNANKSIEVIKRIDIDHLLIETDYPFMTKDPIVELEKVLNKICSIKGLDSKEMDKTLDINASRLFHI